MLKTALKMPLPSRVKWYFSTNNGFNEQEVFLDLVRAGSWHCRLIKIEQAQDSIKQFRLDPTEQEGVLLNAEVALCKLTPSQALHWLQSIQVSYSEQSTQEWLEKLYTQQTENEPLLALAYQAYQSSFLLGSFSYHAWQIAFERRVRLSDTLISEQLTEMTNTPLISIIMPTYCPPKAFLIKAIESVIAQRYPFWELCIADDASPEDYVKETLLHYASVDKRIKVVIREKNGHISAASNSALAIADGAYIALMDHDDELAEDALFYMVQAINKHPEAQVLFSDEDKIDQHGKRFDPHFKPDWNRDLFFSQNYVSHLGVYKASLLRKINGFRLGVEGSQDQDLLLRCLLHITDDQIIHVPKVLYHWRALEGSTALAASEKSYTSDAGIKALVDYFNLAGLPKVEVTSAFVSNTYRVTYPLPDTLPLVSMLIPTRDKIELLRPCVESILAKTHYQHFEILILDNGSIEPETLTYFKTVQLRDERVKVITYNHPFNYSAINNFGAKHAKGEILALINNDIEVINPEWLDEMVRQVLRPDIGCVGAKLYFDDDTIQHAGVVVGLGGVAGHSHKHFPRQHPGYFGRLKCVQNYLAVTAACLLVRKSVYEQVGGLNEADLKVAFNDVDFCLKVYKAGYRNLWTPYAELYHYESKSRGVEDTPEKQARFQVEVNYIRDNWLDLIEHDPCYSIYLTRSFEDFSVKLN
ncbi:glycosyltransferase family 2 protein [Alishewanella longhuensis]